MQTSSIVLGQRGEDRAATWYIEAGYNIADRNWRARTKEWSGELDLVLTRSGLVVFCEVKARANDRYGLPSEAVGPRKQLAIRRLAAAWLREHPDAGRGQRVRFDVASVIGTRVTVIEQAF